MAEQNLRGRGRRDRGGRGRGVVPDADNQPCVRDLRDIKIEKQRKRIQGLERRLAKAVLGVRSDEGAALEYLVDDEQTTFVTNLFESLETNVTIWEFEAEQTDETDESILEFRFGIEPDSKEVEVSFSLINDYDCEIINFDEEQEYVDTACDLFDGMSVRDATVYSFNGTSNCFLSNSNTSHDANDVSKKNYFDEEEGEDSDLVENLVFMMENGAGIAKNTKLGERQGADGEVWEPSIMEGMPSQIGSDGKGIGRKVLDRVHETYDTLQQQEGIAGIQHNAFYLHRALDSNNLREALKYSAQLLSELRTSRLSPHKYYELYMRAFDELRRLEMFFKDVDRHGCSVVDLYELVQHAGNILPRLYLLCTVGSVYIKSKEAPAKHVLKDLVEMCRGVQHPIRGLFLRSYLAQVSRDKLPDIGSEYEDEGDTIMDAVEFVLQNFMEMNKLLVRMRHQGPLRVKEKLEKERSELRDLVGKNLHVLSQIEGVDLEIYRDTVLPRVLEQVVNCKDEIAPYYLMDCIIQVFPDEYHLQTLETLLGACPQFQPTVDIKTVLSQLMERLSNYAASSPKILPEFLQVEAFSKLSNAIGKVIEAQVDMPIVGAIALYVSLVTFTLRVHPDRLDYVDQVLGACVKKLSGKSKLEDSKVTKQVVSLLSAPLDKYNDIVTALTLSNYPRVMDHLDAGTNKVMAMVIIRSIMKNKTCVSTSDKVEVPFELIKGLIKDLDGMPTDELDEEDFNEEQNSVASLMHVLYNDDPEEMMKELKGEKDGLVMEIVSRLVEVDIVSEKMQLFLAFIFSIFYFRAILVFSAFLGCFHFV